MSVKRLDIANVGQVSFYKRRGARSIKLSIKPDGDIRVSLPLWVPYATAVDFVLKHQGWIESKSSPAVALASGNRIGKAHQLIFLNTPTASNITTRLETNQAKVFLPNGVDSSSPEAQAAVSKIAKKALKTQAEQLLPHRLNQLALAHGFSYRSVKIRQLKSRWGSCSHQADIILNYYLMQLPWHLIDYVILHELTHTKVLSHSKAFWDELERHRPGVKEIRREIRQYSPSVSPGVDSYA